MSLSKTVLRLKVLEALDGVPLTIDEICKAVAPTLPFQARPARDMTERAIRELYQGGYLRRGLRSEFNRVNAPEKGRLYAHTVKGHDTMQAWLSPDLFDQETPVIRERPSNVIPMRRRPH